MIARFFAAFSFLVCVRYLCFSAAFAGDGLPTDWQISLPKPVTDIARQMQGFNDLLLGIIIVVVVFVCALLLWVMIRYRESANPVPSKTSHNTTIEVIWTIVPVLVLVVIAIPSFRILYEQFSFPKADVTIKATGIQWHWAYEYPDANVTFESFPVEDKDLKPGQVRNLSVDEEVVVPVNKVVQVLITAQDVIHQWVVPAFGSRADGIPGRMNRTWFKATETGTYYGQCSALCGKNHYFMPVVVRVVSDDEYQNWLAGKKKAASLNANKVASQDIGAIAR